MASILGEAFAQCLTVFGIACAACIQDYASYSAFIRAGSLAERLRRLSLYNQPTDVAMISALAAGREIPKTTGSSQILALQTTKGDHFYETLRLQLLQSMARNRPQRRNPFRSPQQLPYRRLASPDQMNSVYISLLYNTRCMYVPWMCWTWRSGLGGAEDEMDTRVGADNVAHLTDFQPIRCFLERLLHLATAKGPEVTTARVAAAVRMNLCQLGEFGWIACDLCLVPSQNLFCLCLSACHIWL